VKIKEKALNSWDRFLEQVSTLAAEREAESSDGTYHSYLLFRGQSDSEWPLSTTLERWTGENLYVRRYHVGLTAIQSEVESRIDRYWNVPSYPEFEALLEREKERETRFFRLLRDTQLYEYMVYVRHHGFPSPLLDWSKSPYIAAYFAFAHARPETKVAIYAYQEYAGHGKEGWAAAPRIEQLGPHVRTHPRHYLQQAEYTIAIENEGLEMRYCAHDTAFDNNDRESQDRLWKLTIPSSERRRALRYLHLHNISAYSLFGSEDTLMESLGIREFILRE